MEIRLKSGFTGVIPKSHLPTYYYDPNKYHIHHIGGYDNPFKKIINPYSLEKVDINCKLGKFIMNNYAEKIYHVSR